eukprot:6598729-Prymnesium_polylepis.1
MNDENCGGNLEAPAVPLAARVPAPERAVLEAVSCLRGCLNPSAGIHHCRCPNYVIAPAPALTSFWEEGISARQAKQQIDALQAQLAAEKAARKADADHFRAELKQAADDAEAQRQQIVALQGELAAEKAARHADASVRC